MTISGQDIKLSSGAAVAEHLITWPMALATAVWLSGILSSAHLFGPDSPWQRVLDQLASPTNGISLLIAQLGQMWHSSNIRDKIAVANGTSDPKSEGAKS